MTRHSRFCYLDASTVASWLCASAQGCEPIDIASASEVEALLADPEVALCLSELTLVEVHDTLAKMLRSTDKPAFDLPWFEESLDKLMAGLASGRIGVIQPPPKVVEHAMSLVTVASRDEGAKVKAWDATHAITAAGWAREIGASVEIVTADSDFERLLEIQPHFASMFRVQRVTA